MSRTPWGGEKAVLLRKETLVPETEEHLPVYTLTFATPESYGQFTGCRIGTGDVIKVCVPGYKPKSYSMRFVILSMHVTESFPLLTTTLHAQQCRAARRVRYHLQGLPERQSQRLPRLHQSR